MNRVEFGREICVGDWRLKERLCNSQYNRLRFLPVFMGSFKVSILGDVSVSFTGAMQLWCSSTAAPPWLKSIHHINRIASDTGNSGYPPNCKTAIRNQVAFFACA